MARVKATIQVNGRPLRRAYVEHIVFGVGTGMYMTDESGYIRDSNFDAGIDSLTQNADIRIICQNSILRVLDGNAINIGVYQDTSIVNDDVFNIRTLARQQEHYDIMDRCQICYQVVFKPLTFFANQPDPVFPLGRKSSLRDTRDQAKRIDLSFPDQFVGPPLSFVEPKRLADNFPLMHIKADNRIFGDASTPSDLLPRELSHAIHFSFLSKAQRGEAQNKYLQFIITSPVSGVGPFHNFTLRTTPEVAYIEAAEWFSARFMEFMRARQPGNSSLVSPQSITPDIQAEFVNSEWAGLTTKVPAAQNPGAGFPPPPGPLPAPTAIPGSFSDRNPNLTRPTLHLPDLPMVTGGDVEGAVYAAIFVHFSRLVGLDLAASSYFEANAITFGEYRNFIRHAHPQHFAKLEQARVFWGI